MRRAKPKPRRKTKRGLLAFDSGGMFAGSPATSGSAATSVSSTQLDPGGGYTPLMEGVFSGAQGLLNRQYQPYDPSQRFAGFTPDQLQAQQNVRDQQGVYQGDYNQAQGAFNNAATGAAGVGTAGATAFGKAGAGPGGLGAAQPFLNQAGKSWTDPGTADAWMNPFTKNVTDATIQQAQTAFSGPGGIKQGLTDTFTGGGAAQFGRERMGDIAGKLTTDWSRGLTQSLGAINAGGYNAGMTAFGNEQQRQAGLAGTAGQLGIGDVTSQTGLGSAQTTAAAQGVSSNINAGTALQGLGTARQTAGFNDINALSASGAQQQQQQQKLADFNYQQNREAIDFPLKNLQAIQGLGQGWALPTQATSSSSTTGYANPAQGSTAGQIAGAGLALGSLFTPSGKDGTSAGGNIISGIGDMFGGTKAPGSGTTAARGGHIRGRTAFGPGGMVPVTRAVRQRVQARMPSIMQRLQGAQQGQPGGPGVTPGQTPGMMPMPQRAFASGGSVDEEQDRAMVTRGIHQHERDMHHARANQLTKLRLAFGGSTGRSDSDFIPSVSIPQQQSGAPVVLPPSQPVMPTAFGASANGATGSGGDSTGGVSGTGGVGGSASDAAGGSAAAGVGGDDGGTYARGGRLRFAKGGFGGILGGSMAGGGGDSGFGSLPWLSMAKDAYGIGREASDGDQGETPMPDTPFDPAAGIWGSLSGGKRATETESGRMGHQIGYEVGDIASNIFPLAAPLFREGFGRLGSGVGEMVGGNFGKGVQNLAAGTPFELVFHGARGGRPAFDDGGSVDDALLAEAGLGDSQFLRTRPQVAPAVREGEEDLDPHARANRRFYEGLARDGMTGKTAFMTGLADTMLPGVADELRGGIAALTHPESSYGNELELARAKARMAEEGHPGSYYGGMGTGMASSIGAFGGTLKALQAMPWFARLSPLRQAAVAGAAQAGPAGFASGEGGFGPRLASAFGTLPWGAGIGVGLHAGAKYGPRVYRAVRSAFGG